MWGGLAPAEPLPLPGDIVFIGDTGGWADIGARLSTTDQRYGHVGIAITTSQGVEVIHASGAPGTGGVVTNTPYAEFTKKAGLIAHYRLIEEDALEGFVHAAAHSAANPRPFDKEFSLTSVEAVYCTELVWRLGSSLLGVDIVPEKSEIFGEAVITLEDLQLSPHLRAVRHIQNQPEKKAAP